MAKRLNLTGKEEIGRGTNGSIYQVGDKVIKINILNHGRNIKSNLGRYKRVQEEYEVQNDLYNSGINVPRPYGIIRTILDGKKKYGLLMEKINGETLGKMRRSSKINLSEYHLILGKMIREIEKAYDLGFSFNDTQNNENVMIDKNGKIFLIDFGGCSSPKNLEVAVA